jgi:CubicO group peptidase (beta-lactamase class C family)
MIAALTVALLNSAAASAAQAQSATAEALAACYDKQAALAPFSGVVLAERGDESFVRTAGKFSSDAGAMPRDARFRLASVQKVLTKVAIGQLVDAGRIKLDAPVTTYLPDLPPEFAAITIDHLLQHRSGVAGFTLMTPQIASALAGASTARDLVPAVISQPLGFKPGERQQYSNGGYFLLGAVIEQVTGKEYGTYLEEALFRPLGMTSTSLAADPRTANGFTRMAPGGAPLTEARPLPAAMSLQRGTPAGNGVSTADDLIKLGRALSGDQLISKAVKERLFPRRNGEWRVGQSGGNIGVNSDFAVFPDRGWSLVVLSNYDPPAGELMGEALRGVLLGKGCTPLSPKDRPSPFRQPPPGRQTQQTTG